MNVDISAIQKDTSIQCRAIIDTATVNDYAERMTEGDKFPPVILYGTKDKCWIGDGWHRIMSWEQIGAVAVPAELRPGGRVEALKHALSANALHGLKRSNADKRRCVEIALKEFADLSSRAIAEMCGVSTDLVIAVRPEQVSDFDTSKVTGRDGKQYPATRTRREKEPEQEEGEDEPKERRVLGPPCIGMQYARIAIMNLEQIEADDIEREEAFDHVKRWIDEHEKA